jgi:LacI family transcriptional regulator
MNGVITAYRGSGVELSVFDQPSAVTSPNPALAALPVTDRVDGLLVMGIPLDTAVAARLRESALPTVLFESESDGFSTVMIDNVREGRAAGAVMVERKPAAVGFIGIRQLSDDYVFSSRLRESGVRDALAQAGIPFDDVVEVAEGSDEVDDVARAMLERHRGAPFGVIAHYDGLAATVLRAAASLGLRVPDDVAVIGFDDSELARTLDLTSLHVPFEEAGETAARLLSEQISGARAPRRIQLESTVVRRGSA